MDIVISVDTVNDYVNGINIKVLDLIVRDEYFGINKNLKKEEAIKFGKNSYASLSEIVNYLKEISNRNQEEYHMWKVFGIPMSGYFIGNQWVQVKNSSRGAQYYEYCNEGMVAMSISVGEILHLSGCKNKDWYYDLKGKSKAEIKKAFEEMLSLFENTELIKH